MRNYDGLKNKLKLDLIATISFFPLETRNKCNEVTQKLEEVVDKNIYDYIKIVDNIQTLISMYKTLLLFDIADEDMADLVAVRRGLTGLTFYPIYVLDVSALSWES